MAWRRWRGVKNQAAAAWRHHQREKWRVALIMAIWRWHAHGKNNSGSVASMAQRKMAA
jgi:hypothetical protein